MHIRKFLTVFVLSSASYFTAANASQLVYQPTNPSFGGNPLNGTYLLGQAGANNYKFTQPPKSQTQNTQQTFAQQITASLLSQIAAQIGNDILGENAQKSGTFSIGGQTITFNRVGSQVNITLTDPSTGGQTQIQVPVPAY